MKKETLKVPTHRHQRRESFSSTDKSHDPRFPRPHRRPPSSLATRPSSDHPPCHPDRNRRPRDAAAATAAVAAVFAVVAARFVCAEAVDQQPIAAEDPASCRDAADRNLPGCKRCFRAVAAADSVADDAEDCLAAARDSA